MNWRGSWVSVQATSAARFSRVPALNVAFLAYK
jgi:hypothetical protein